MRDFQEFIIEGRLSVVVEWRVSHTGYEHFAIVTVDGWRLEEPPRLRHSPPITREDGVTEPGGWRVWDPRHGYVENLAFALGGRAQGQLGSLLLQVLQERLEQLEAAPHPIKPDRDVRISSHPEWRFFARECIDDVLVDPRLPVPEEDLQGLPVHECPQVVLERWLGRWYVVTLELRDQLESYESACARLKRMGSALRHSAEEWRERQQALEDAWLEQYPSGRAYAVRRIQGEHEIAIKELERYASLDEAISEARRAGAMS